LYEHIINSYCLLPDGTIYKKVQGTPSGAICTTSDNTFSMTQLLIVGILRCIKPEMKQHVTPSVLCSLIGLKINGDDNLVGFKREQLEDLMIDDFFDNPKQFVAAMCTTGLTYECNGDEVWKKPSEISFLSSRPVDWNGMWVSEPADWDRFYTKLVWGPTMSLPDLLRKILQDMYRAIFNDEVVDVLKNLIKTILSRHPGWRDNVEVVEALRLNLDRDLIRGMILGRH